MRRYNGKVRPPLPLRRWTINLLSGLSLLIFLLAMGIWVRSYFVDDKIYRYSRWDCVSLGWHFCGIGMVRDSSAFTSTATRFLRSSSPRDGAITPSHNEGSSWKDMIFGGLGFNVSRYQLVSPSGSSGSSPSRQCCGCGDIDGIKGEDFLSNPHPDALPEYRERGKEC